MCGRFVTGTDELSWRQWATILELSSDSAPPLGAVRIPADKVEIVRRSPDRSAQLELVDARWGLAPSWMKQPLKGAPQYNVRSETAPRKFKKYYAQRRCVLPASGFWVRRDAGGERLFVRASGQALLGLAGLWTEREHEGETLRSCTVLTREANAELGRFHERMPVVLGTDTARRWLSADVPQAELDALCETELPLELDEEPADR